MSLLTTWNIKDAKIEEINRNKSLSPSEIVTFEECSYKWKLINLDRLSKFETNIDFLFGKAAHEAIQNAFHNKTFSNISEFFPIFKGYIEKEKENLKQKDFDKLGTLLVDAHSIFDDFEKNFEQATDGKISLKDIEDVATEEKLIEWANMTWLFVGRLDLVFRMDDKYFIWDIKTSKSSWRMDKRNNIAILSQPILYKYFWAKKHEIEKLRNISTAFLILKKKGGKTPVELFKVSSGPIATQRCLNNLDLFSKLIEKRRFLKCYNKFICRWCEFNNTEHCPGDKS